MRRVCGVLAVLLAACAPQSDPRVAAGRDAAAAPAPRPHIEGYAAAAGAQEIAWSRRSLADDFIALTFDTEWGVRRDRLLRWNGGVRIALIGAELGRYRDYAADLVARLDAATGDHHSVMLVADGDGGERGGDIVFRTAPRDEMQRYAPGAQCFLTPFDGDWRKFRSAGYGGAHWATTDRLETITVFIPEFADPHEIRVCLEEEAAQSLGVVNDLYRLEDSIFNDDNAHLRLTAFDALMLRVLYDPAMRPGMTREDARAAALEALGRALRSFGDRRRPSGPADDVHDDLRKQIWRAGTAAERRRRAGIAVRRMREENLRDHRLAELLETQSALARRDNEHAKAIDHLREAEAQLIAVAPADNVRLALTRVSLAALLKREGAAREALRYADLAIPVLAANAHDRRLAEALRWKAVSHSQLGEDADAVLTARSALDWARHVHGADAEIVRRWRREFADIGLF